jgi:hypothetical protein
MKMMTDDPALASEKTPGARSKNRGFPRLSEFPARGFYRALKKDRPNGKENHPGRLVERAGSFVPTIIVNGDGRYFASPAGRPSHVSYATAHAVPDPR